MNIQVQWWFKKFCKGNKRLEDEEHSGWLSEANNQLRAIIEVDPLTTIQEAAEELNVDHSKVTRHLKQIGKVKKFDECVPHELTEIKKKIIILKCPLLLGAGVRSSARGKGHEEGGSAYAKVGSSLRSPPGYSRASTPKNQSLPTLLLCALTSDITGGCPPPPSLSL